MKYYIYPAGGHGKMLAFNMDLLGLKYEFIDDLNPEYKSLDELANELGANKESKSKRDDEYIVLLACDRCQENSQERQKTLVQNLAKNNLKYKDGFTFTLPLIIKKHHINLKNSVALVANKSMNNKHYGFMPKFFMDKGLDVVYVFNDIDEYQKSLENSEQYKKIFIPLSHMYLFEVAALLSCYINYYAICECAQPLLSDKTFSLMLDHSLTLARIGIIYNKIYGTDGILVFKKFENKYCMVAFRSDIELLSTYSKKIHPLFLGYPGLDINLQNFKVQEAQKIVYILPISYEACDKYISLIQSLYKLGYQSIYRPHPGYKNREDAIRLISFCQNFKGASVDLKPQIDPDIMAKISFCISDYSSTCFSVPITNLRPCIVYYPQDIFGKDFEKYEINGKTFSFSDERLHIIARSEDEVINAVKNLDLAKYEKSIMDFRQKEMINLGRASEHIVDFVLEHINKS